MKVIKKILVIVLVSICMTGCIGGTDASDRAPVDTSVVFITENTSNFPTVGSSTVKNVLKLTENHVYNAAYYYEPVQVIVNDSSPSLESLTLKDPGKTISSSKHKRLANDYTEEICSSITLFTADSQELDTLKAFQLAGSYLACQTSDVKVIYAFISGRSTTGVTDMTEENLLDYNAGDIADKLKDISSLPSLDHVTVYITGIGCCSSNGTQSETPDSVKFRLQEFWDTILTKGGATVEFIPLPLTGENETDLPFVSPVFYTEDDLDLTSLTKESFRTSAVRFTEKQIAFNPDTAELADQDSAQSVLQPLISILKKDNTFCVTICGSTASYSDEKTCFQLALYRAFTVRSLLIKEGVNEGQISVMSIGRRSGFP